MNVHEVIRKPLLTEKGANLNETSNTVLFEVNRSANKIEIKQAVEEIFKVKVASVHTMNVRGKKKRMGRNEGMSRSWKKAMVTLQAGEKLDFLEGVN